MSRNGLIAAGVVLIAIVVFGYVALNSSGTSNSPTTPTPLTVNASPASQAELAVQGQQLFTQFRCNVCHTITGSNGAGPTLKGLAGSQVTLNTGQTITADSNYLRQSIVDPDSQIVAGYGPSVMSAATDPFQSQIQQGNNVTALVAYIQSLK